MLVCLHDSNLGPRINWILLKWGKILVCKSSEMVPFRLTEEKEFSEMADCALDAGALGMIVIIDGDEIKSSTFPLPVAFVWDTDHTGLKNLKDYMRSNR